MVIEGGIILFALECMAMYEDEVIFPDRKSNEIYSYNFETGEVRLCWKIKNEKDNITNLFGGIIPFENCLYLYPMAGKAIYKIHGKSIQRIDIKNDQLCHQGDRAKFVSAHIWKKKIYFIGAYASIIMIYDTDSEDIEYIDYGIGMAENGEINARQSMMDEGKIYIPIARMNKIIVFDMKTKQVVHKQVGKKSSAYISISKYGDFFYLVPKGKGNVVWWNERTNDYGEIEFPIDFKRAERGFSGSVTYGGYIWLFPMNAEGIWKIDVDNCLLKQCEIVPLNISNIFASLKHKDKLLFFSNSDYKLYVVDDGGESVNTIQVSLSEVDSKDYMDRRLNSFFSVSPIIIESDVVNLKHFLRKIKRR